MKEGTFRAREHQQAPVRPARAVGAVIVQREENERFRFGPQWRQEDAYLGLGHDLYALCHLRRHEQHVLVRLVLDLLQVLEVKRNYLIIEPVRSLEQLHV